MNPYLRQILVGLSFIPMWIINFVIAPTLWLVGAVNRVRENKTPILVWFVDTDEPDHTQNNYGDTAYRKERNILDIEERNFFKRFQRYFIWSVLRNSFFHYRMHVVIPKRLKSEVFRVIVNTTNYNTLHLMNQNERGKIHIIEKRDETKYFRYSLTKEVKIFNALYVINIQLGVNGIDETNRYLFKFKIKNIKYANF